MDSYNCFSFVFMSYKVTFHIKLHVLRVAHLLTMTKPSGGICPNAMGDTLYQFRNDVYAFNIAMFNNKFIPTLIRNNSQGQMWHINPQHHVHLGPSPWLGCSLARCDECF